MALVNYSANPLHLMTHWAHEAVLEEAVEDKKLDHGAADTAACKFHMHRSSAPKQVTWIEWLHDLTRSKAAAGLKRQEQHRGGCSVPEIHIPLGELHYREDHKR